MQIDVDTGELIAISRAFSSASGRVGATVSAILRKTAYDIESDAKTLAPVDTGALKSSIGTTVVGSGLAGIMRAEIGPTVEYGDFVERGTSHMDPQPYMAPAFDRRLPAMDFALLAAATEGLA